ncbi:MAG: Gfo/Idh/MocA family oxidoreductase, partial [Gemmatimonadetes bacterium]|nr:Gfo/Idh/MocA family oxidoreductase [Gemmatimonadota bacterium]
MKSGSEHGPLLRHGVIGVGGIGGVHCRIASESPDVTLTGVADKDPDRLAGAAKQYGAEPFADWREMVSSGRFDSVAIATPSLLHASMAIECMEAGLHVFLEKPIALTLADADRVVETARAKRRVLTVGHQYRVHRLHRTTKKLIEEGAIGRPRQILWTWAQSRDEEYYSHYPWRQNWKDAGGGVTMHSLSHDLNVLTWLIGAPVEVSALAVNQKQDAETEDFMSASVLFEGGAVATITACVNRPQSHVVRQIAGERGMIEIPDTQSLTFDHKDRVMLGRFDTHAPPAPDGIGGLTGQPRVHWSRVPLEGDPPKWKK